MSLFWFRARFGAATAPRRRGSRGRQIVEWPAMELFDRLSGDQGRFLTCSLAWVTASLV